VFRAAVHVENDGIRVGEHALVFRPAVEHELDLHLRRALREALREQLRARVELVHPRRMRRLARHDDELRATVGRLGGQRRNARNDQTGNDSNDPCFHERFGGPAEQDWG